MILELTTMKKQDSSLYLSSIPLMGGKSGSEVKASACNAGDLGSIPGLGRSPGEGNGNPLQYSCLENPMDWGAWWAAVHRVTKSRTGLSDFSYLLIFQMTSHHLRRYLTVLICHIRVALHTSAKYFLIWSNCSLKQLVYKGIFLLDP